MWHDPDFRRLWRAAAISRLGSEIGELALPLLAIITLAAQASEVGLLRAAQFLPFLVATLPFGVLVDRSAKRKLMIVADLGRFVLIAAIPLAVWLGLRQIEVLYVLVFAVGSLTVLYQLAEFAFVPVVVPPGQIIDANGRLSATESSNEIAGKGLGGVIVDALTAPLAVLFDSLTYLLSAFSLARMSTPDAVPRERRQTPAWREATEGLSIALRNRFVRPLLGEATTFNVFNEIFVIGLLLYAVRGLGLRAAAIGMVFAAGGIGSFLGAWYGARVTARFGYGRVLLVTLVLGNTAPAGVVLLRGDPQVGVVILVTVFLLMGIGIGIANVHATSLRQVAVPKSHRGRVNAGYRLVSWGSVPLGASLGGLLASLLGPFAAMAIGGLGIPLATLWVLFSPIPRLASIADATVATASRTASDATQGA